MLRRTFLGTLAAGALVGADARRSGWGWWGWSTGMRADS